MGISRSEEGRSSLLFLLVRLGRVNTSTLPDELMLESSVADIVKKGWGAYITVYNSHKIISAILQVYRDAAQNTNKSKGSLTHNGIVGSVTVHHHSMFGLYQSSANITKLIHQHARPASLSVMGPLMGIVNTLPGWELYTIAYNSSPHEEVLRHLVSMSKALQEHSVFPVTLAAMRVDHPAGLYGSMVDRECEVLELLISILSTLMPPVAEQALIAILHNAYIARTRCNPNGECISLYSIAWSYIEPLILELNGGVLPEGLDWLLAVARVLSGDGDASTLLPASLEVRVEKDYRNDLLLRSKVTEMGDLDRLYKAIWKCLPDNVHPTLIGLGTLIGEKDVETNDFHSILRIAHKMVEDAITHEDMAVYMQSLAYAVGHDALVRMMTCLRKYIEGNPEKDHSLADTFCSYVENYKIRFIITNPTYNVIMS